MSVSRLAPPNAMVGIEIRRIPARRRDRRSIGEAAAGSVPVSGRSSLLSVVGITLILITAL